MRGTDGGGCHSLPAALLRHRRWASRPDLQRFPLYHVSGKRTRGSEREGWRDTVANKGLDVYRTFVGQMSGRLQASMVASDRNPWAFRHVLITDPSGFKVSCLCAHLRCARRADWHKRERRGGGPLPCLRPIRRTRAPASSSPRRACCSRASRGSCLISGARTRATASC